MKKKYKIYFLEPNAIQFERPGFDEFMEPLNLSYIAAAALNEGHNVIVKQQFDKSIDDIVDEIVNFQADILAITVITLFFNTTKKIIAKIKENNSEIITIGGGSHINGDPEESAHIFDYIIVGEGETPFIKLLEELPNNRKPNIPGVGYFNEGKFYINNFRERNSKIIKFPYRESLDFSRYTGLGNGPPPIPKVGFSSMLMSRGCRFNCDFCVNKLIWRKSNSIIIPVVKREPADIIKEMIYLKNKFDVGYIWFQDADFPLYDRKYIKLFFNKKKYIPEMKYSFMTRIENIILHNNITEAKEFLRELKRSGCHMIGFGIESFSTKLLKQMKKNTSFNRVKKTLELVFNAGIIPVAFFIIGYPDETEQSLELTYKIAKSLKIIRFRFAIFYPFKGTTSRGRIKEKDWLIPEYQTYDLADSEHQVIRCNIPDKKLGDYFVQFNSKIYFEKEYRNTLEDFYEMHPDMRNTIDFWQDFVNTTYK